MEEPKFGRVRMTDQMVVTAFGLALVYWITDTFLYFFSSIQFDLTQRLFGPEWTGLYSRLIVLCFFVIFGSHAQYNINKRRQAEEELSQLRQQLQAIQGGPPIRTGNNGK